MQGAELLRTLAGGDLVSGAALAEQAGMTRAGVWKQIEALRARGVPVQSRGNRGYCLPWPIQPLDQAAIEVACRPQARPAALQVFWELDSTSSELQRRGPSAADLSFVLAETQSAGRGRRGRPWLSPPGLNIYMSCIKRFEQGFASLSGLSLAVGVMVQRALADLGIHGAGLKWPNDLLAPQGKLAGILVELSGEYQGPCAAVIGVGLNLRLTDALRAQAAQPATDLAELAGGMPPDRNQAAAALVSALVDGLRQFETAGFAAFIEDYRRYDLLLGQPLQLSGAQGDFSGTGAGVDARGALWVQSGEQLRAIDSADVTVRRA